MNEQCLSHSSTTFDTPENEKQEAFVLGRKGLYLADNENAYPRLDLSPVCSCIV